MAVVTGVSNQLGPGQSADSIEVAATIFIAPGGTILKGQPMARDVTKEMHPLTGADPVVSPQNPDSRGFVGVWQGDDLTNPYAATDLYVPVLLLRYGHGSVLAGAWTNDEDTPVAVGSILSTHNAGGLGRIFAVDLTMGLIDNGVDAPYPLVPVPGQFIGIACAMDDKRAIGDILITPGPSNATSQRLIKAFICP